MIEAEHDSRPSKIKQHREIPVLESVSEDLRTVAVGWGFPVKRETVGVDRTCPPGSSKTSKASVGAMR